MSASAKVVVDVGSISSTSSGTVTAVVFVDFGRTCFPEKNWSDLVVTVIRGWSDAILRMLNEQTTGAELMFYDGPFWLRVTQAGEKTWTVECLLDHVKPKKEYEQEIEWRPFVASLIISAERLLDVCVRNKWRSKDIDELSRLLPLLRSHIRKGDVEKKGRI